MIAQKEIESVYRDKLATKLKGQVEVKTPAGMIDILTEDKLVEVKVNGNHWKKAVGQVLSYAYYYPNHQKVIAFPGPIKEATREVCAYYKIEIMNIPFENSNQYTEDTSNAELKILETLIGCSTKEFDFRMRLKSKLRAGTISETDYLLDLVKGTEDLQLAYFILEEVNTRLESTVDSTR